MASNVSYAAPSSSKSTFKDPEDKSYQKAENKLSEKKLKKKVKKDI